MMGEFELCLLTVDDLPGLVRLAREMHAESPNYRDLPFDGESVAAWAAMHIRRDDMLATGVKAGGILVAALMATVTTTYFGPGKIAQEDGLFVIPEFRGTPAGAALIHTFLRFADNQDADRAVVTASAGIDDERTIAFLEKKGFTHTGTCMRFDYG